MIRNLILRYQIYRALKQRKRLRLAGYARVWKVRG